MKEKYENPIKLEGLNAATMEIVMGYIYTAKVEITKENAVALLSACDYLQIPGKRELIFLSCIFLKRAETLRAWLWIHNPSFRIQLHASKSMILNVVQVDPRWSIWNF